MGFSGPELISDSQKDYVNVCVTQMSPHLNLFLGKWILSSQYQRPKEPSRLSSPTDPNANNCHGMGVQQSKRIGDWNMCEGTIEMEA